MPKEVEEIRFLRSKCHSLDNQSLKLELAKSRVQSHLLEVQAKSLLNNPSNNKRKITRGGQDEQGHEGGVPRGGIKVITSTGLHWTTTVEQVHHPHDDNHLGRFNCPHHYHPYQCAPHPLRNITTRRSDWMLWTKIGHFNTTLKGCSCECHKKSVTDKLPLDMDHRCANAKPTNKKIFREQIAVKDDSKKKKIRNDKDNATRDNEYSKRLRLDDKEVTKKLQQKPLGSSSSSGGPLRVKVQKPCREAPYVKKKCHKDSFSSKAKKIIMDFCSSSDDEEEELQRRDAINNSSLHFDLSNSNNPALTPSFHRPSPFAQYGLEPLPEASSEDDSLTLIPPPLPPPRPYHPPPTNDNPTEKNEKEAEKILLLESIISQLQDELRESKEQNELLEFRLLEIEESSASSPGPAGGGPLGIPNTQNPKNNHNKRDDDSSSSSSSSSSSDPKCYSISEEFSEDDYQQYHHPQYQQTLLLRPPPSRSPVRESSSSGSDCSSSSSDCLSLQESGIFEGSETTTATTTMTTSQISRELRDLTFQIERELLNPYSAGESGESPKKRKSGLKEKEIKRLCTVQSNNGGAMVDHENENDDHTPSLFLLMKREEKAAWLQKIAELETLVSSYEQRNFEVEEALVEMKDTVQFTVNMVPLIMMWVNYYYWWHSFHGNRGGNLMKKSIEESEKSHNPPPPIRPLRTRRKHKLSKPPQEEEFQPNIKRSRIKGQENQLRVPNNSTRSNKSPEEVEQESCQTKSPESSIRIEALDREMLPGEIYGHKFPLDKHNLANPTNLDQEEECWDLDGVDVNDDINLIRRILKDYVSDHDDVDGLVKMDFVLLKDLRRLKDENDQLRLEISEIYESKRRIEEGLRMELTELRERLEEVERSERKLEEAGALKDLKEKKNSEKIVELREELQFLRSKCCQLQDEVDSRVLKEGRLKGELEKVKVDLREALMGIEDRERQVESVEMSLGSQITRLKSQLEELRGTYGDVECSNGMLKEEVCYLEKTVEEALVKVRESEVTISSITMELRSKDKRVEELEEEVRHMCLPATSANNPYDADTPTTHLDELSDFNRCEGGLNGVVRGVREAAGAIKGCGECGDKIGKKLLDIGTMLIPLIQTLQQPMEVEPDPDAELVVNPSADDDDDDQLINGLQQTMSHLTLQITRLEEQVKACKREKNTLIYILARRIAHLSVHDVEGHFLQGIFKEMGSRDMDRDYHGNTEEDEFTFESLPGFILTERLRVLEMLQEEDVGNLRGEDENSCSNSNTIITSPTSSSSSPSSFRVVRRVGEDALLVSWTLPRDEVNSSGGYEIAVNGSTYLRIPKPNRHKAILFGVNLNQPLTLTFKCRGVEGTESTITFIP